MRHPLYNQFIKPTSTDSDLAEREIVLNYLLIGILVLSLVSFIVTLFSGPLASHGPGYFLRLFYNFVTSAFIVGLYVAARYRKRYKAVAVILTLLVTAFGCFVALQWGILDPDSVLLLSLSIVMAGILIGARYSLYVACLFVAVLAYLQHGESTGSLHPDLSWLGSKPIFGDVVSFSVILLLIALVSWLFNRQMEMSLKRAQRSEKALQRQKQQLEIKVEKRARQLEEAQLEKMQQLYRFAELGQLSTALFHDLANHLSTVNVDIEGFKGLSQGDQPDIMHRIQQNVGHINAIVGRVRQQIGGKSSIEAFDIAHEIEEVVKILEATAEQAGVTITVTADKSVKPALLCRGDVTRFRQVILNLVCNGIEAYPVRRTPRALRVVTVTLKRQGTALTIDVNDRGLGIRTASQAKIFEPFYTTKSTGVGIGLFIVKQVLENDFNGTISLSSNKAQGTTFSVSLPKTYYAKTT